MYADVDTFNRELQAEGHWVFACGLHPIETATVVRVTDGRTVTTDGPFAETKEFLGGFWILKADDLDAGPGPGRAGQRRLSGRGGGPAAPRGPPKASRSGPERHRRRRRDRPGLPSGVRPMRRDARADLRRHRHRRGGRAGGVRGRHPHLADRPGCRRTRARGSPRPPATGPSTACAARPSGTSGTSTPRACTARLREAGRRRRYPGAASGGGGAGAGRPAPPDLHLLPPGAGPEHPGRAHPAPGRRPADPGDRPGLPGPRADDGPAHRPGQAQDPGRPDPDPGARRRAAAGPAPRRPRGHLPGLQRGLRRVQRARPGPRRPVRRGHPAGPAAATS